MHAVAQGKVEAVKVLLSCGSVITIHLTDISAHDNEGVPAPMQADNQGIIEVLTVQWSHRNGSADIFPCCAF